MNNKINPILDAMSEIDDNIVTNTKKRRKRPLLIAAVAAAALMLLMGAAVVYEYTDHVTLNNKKMFDFNYTVKENVTIPTHEELMELGGQFVEGTDPSFNMYHFNALPSEIYQMVNLDPLFNENFTEETGDVMFRASKLEFDPDGPIGNGEVGQFEMQYKLYDENIRKTVAFVISCKVDERAGWSIGINSGDSKHNKQELISLNDSSQALIYSTFWEFNDGTKNNKCSAVFSYDGIIYEMWINDSSPDEMKQVLDDLGVL